MYPCEPYPVSDFITVDEAKHLLQDVFGRTAGTVALIKTAKEYGFIIRRRYQLWVHKDSMLDFYSKNLGRLRSTYVKESSGEYKTRKAQ